MTATADSFNQKSRVFQFTNSHLYGYCSNNPIRYVDPTGLEIEEKASIKRQLEYLKDYVDRANKLTKFNRALMSARLRTEMRTTKKFDIEELFYSIDGDEIFMNETLRDFLNLSDTGNDYSIDDMDNNLGWILVSPPGDSEHQNERSEEERNRKYVNINDGREAVFMYIGNDTWTLSSNPLDKGTYNYARNFKGKTCWMAGTEHANYDMLPYYRQFGKKFPLYWMGLNKNANPASYGVNSNH